MKLPAYEAGLQNNIFIVESTLVRPDSGGVRGDFLKKLFVKFALIPLFQRGRLEVYLLIWNYSSMSDSSSSLYALFLIMNRIKPTIKNRAAKEKRTS